MYVLLVSTKVFSVYILQIFFVTVEPWSREFTTDLFWREMRVSCVERTPSTFEGSPPIAYSSSTGHSNC